ncbi:MAG: hypothetical protein D6734_01380 [Candidatus Schekmanbacteria bacterium]|nr:MAG: hypothetical protein D6734_01380 [Candidatus Schekmanbacteria bacterium]
MGDDEKKLAQALIIAMKNEIRVIELYSQCLKRDITSDSRSNIEVVVKDEERHMKMLKEFFEKKLQKKLDVSKLKDDSLSSIKNMVIEPYSAHLIDVAMGYEHREKNHFEKTLASFGSDPELKELFDKLIEDEVSHIEVLEKERKAIMGQAFDDFELDLYVRE